MSEFREWSTWFAGAIGGIAGFAFANYTEILDRFYPATVTVASRPYPLEIELTLASVSQDETHALNFQGGGPVENLKVRPGYYVLSTKYEGDVFDSEVVYLERGRDTNLRFPPPEDLEGLFGELRFFVSGLKEGYVPAERTPLEINSNVNGYVWVYEDGNQAKISRVFPPKNEPLSNEISAGSALDYTSLTKDSFYAQSDLGEYQILFVLTSTSDAALADTLAGNITGLDVKGFGSAKAMWGYFSHTYTVKSP